MTYVQLTVRNRPPLNSDLSQPYEQGTVWVDTSTGNIYDYTKFNGIRRWVKRETVTSNLADTIHSAPVKVAIAGADEFGLWDSSTSSLSKTTWLNATTVLKTYFDSIYAPIGPSHVRLHALDSVADHSIGGLTNTYLVKSNGTTLVPATNTDAEVSSAVSLRHSNALDHTQNTDTGTTATTFTFDSDSLLGKVAMTVAAGAANKLLTLTNTPLTADRTITFPDDSGTVALTTGAFLDFATTTLDAVPTTIVLPSIALNTIVTWTGSVEAVDTATGEMNSYVVQGSIKNVGSHTELSGVPLEFIINEDNESWDLEFVANTGADRLELLVTGEAATTINWEAKLAFNITAM